MGKMEGKISKTEAGFLTYDVYEAEANLVFPVVSAIERQFGFEVPRLPGFSLDGPVVEMTRGDVKIIVSWDNWSGLFVMAIDEKGDADIQRIGAYLDGVIDTLVPGK